MKHKRYSGSVKGFSLVEILAVLVLVGLMATVVGSGFARSLKGAKIRSAGKDLVAALRYTRSQAILHHKEQVLQLNAGEGNYVAPGKKTVELPESIEIKFLTAESEVTGDQTGNIRFYPDGASTGGQIELSAGTRSWTAHVVWLTGEIWLEQSDG